MKTELDTLRERGAQLIRTADPTAPFLTPKQGEALCAFIVDALEAQRKLAEQSACSGAQVWGTALQIAKRLGMDRSNVSRILKDLVNAGKIHTLKEDAIPGRPMIRRYHIGDVETALMGTTPANDRKEARR